jgi:hypothetical protein
MRAREPKAYGFGSQELWTWCLAFAALAYWAEILVASQAADPLGVQALANSFLGAGAFSAAAWLMIIARSGKLGLSDAAPAGLIMATLAMGLLCAVPIGMATTLALVLLGAALAAQPGPSRGGREIGYLLFGLAATCASRQFSFIHAAAARIDAQIVVRIVHLAGIPATVKDNLVGNDHFAIEVLNPCASSMRLASVLLAYIVVAIWVRGTLRRSDLPWMAASLLASIVLTEIRLSLMVPSLADWDWWHNGTGSWIYEYFALAVAIAIPLAARQPAYVTPPLRQRDAPIA